MGLKYKIAKLEDVPENVRSMYKAEGTEFVLDVDGVVARERLDEFRTNNIALQQQIDKFKNVDPQKYQELMTLQRELQEGELIKKGDVEGVVNLRVTAMKTDLEGKVTTLTNQNNQLTSQLSKVMVDDQVKSHAIKAGVTATAMDDVVLRARGVYVMDPAVGAPVPKNEKGETIFGKDGATPMPMAEWLTGLKTTAPHLFAQSSGGGAGGGGRPGAVDTSKMSAVDKIAAGIASGGLRDLPGAAA